MWSWTETEVLKRQRGSVSNRGILGMDAPEGVDCPRVLHLITRFLGGGAEKTTLNTLNALQSSSEEYDLRLGVGASYDSEYLADVEETGIDTVVFKSIRHYNPVGALLGVVEVARYLQRESISVLHTHSTEAGIIGRFASRLADVPVVIHEIHGDPVTSDRSTALNATICWLERAATTEPMTLIVKSNKIKRTYLERGIGEPEQYERIYHGVDLERFRTAKPVQEHEMPVLLFVGRLSQGKGLDDLLEATHRLQEKIEFRLFIAGEGPLRDELEEQIGSRGIGDCVELLGYREDIPELMAGADVLALPSYREGTPRVITEALAAGTPVVSTNISGIPEQIADGETGFLIEPGDVTALVDRLESLLIDERMREAMGEKAAGSVSKFSRGVAQESYRELYRKLL